MASKDGTAVGVGVPPGVSVLFPSCFAELSPQVQVVPSAPIAAASITPRRTATGTPAAVGERSTIALGSEGLLAAAGANDAGSLGDGGTTARNTFGAVSVVSGAIAVDIGGLSFAAAIGAEGTTWTWGDNSAKQLGNSTLTPGGTPSPTAVPSFDAIP